jgi:hypothetical protein
MSDVVEVGDVQLAASAKSWAMLPEARWRACSAGKWQMRSTSR